MKLAGFIALRIARSKRSSTLSLVTMISIIGIACGVMALTVVLAVTDGFRAAFQERILGVFPHLVVMRNSSAFSDYEPVLETLRGTPGVVGATPLTGDEMMVAHDAVGNEAGQFRAGATVQGVDLATVESVLDIKRLVKKGRLEDLGEAPRIELGEEVRVLDPVEGASLTLVRTAGHEPLVLTDERTRPDTDHCRLKVLDLRVTVQPVSLKAIDGIAKTVFEVENPVVLVPLEDAWSRELELPVGTWELGPTGERLALEAERAYAIILWHPRPGALASTLLTEAPEGRHGEREALVRFVDASPTGTPPLTWSSARGPLALTSSGQMTTYFPVPARLPGVILGQALATRLHADLDAELTFVTPLRGLDNKMVGPFGMMPSSTRFRVVGIFEAGFHDHDARLALTNLEVSQRFMNRGRMIRTIAVKTTSLLDLDRTKAAIKRALDPVPFEDLLTRTLGLEEKLTALTRTGADARIVAPSPDAPFIGALRNVTSAIGLLKFNGATSVRPNRYQVIDWREKNINLFNALELQKVVLTIFFFIIILVGSFVVVGSQIMVVHEKTPDIAILKAMGATSGFIRLVFTLQGLFVSVIGLAVGLGLGVGLVALIDAVEYELEASIYLIDHLPAVIRVGELVLIGIGTLACTLLTTQISAGRAASKSPVTGLRQVD
jgi:lipoprotein-releasing system permease protein